MKNFVQPGKTIDFTNTTGSTILAGTPVVIGSTVAILTDDCADQTTQSANAEGVFTVPLVASLAITKGDKVYWNASSAWATKTDTDKPMGTAWEDAASNNGFVNVKLVPAATVNVAATIAALGSTTNIPDSTCDGGSTPTATQVQDAIDATVVEIEARLDAIEAKIDATLASLKAAGLMA